MTDMSRIQDLMLDHIRQHPVWCWDDAEEFHIPVLEHDPLPENLGTLFIHARCTLSSGHEFEGYIVGLHAVHALAVFAADCKYLFNAKLSELAFEESLELSKQLGIGAQNVFPIRYETDLHFNGEEPLAGEFELR